MDERSENGGRYRYGYQGQEKDDEIKGEGNSINYKYRMHDPRVGRFFAIDPISFIYPHNSPYAFSENQVINAGELEGLEKDLLYSSADLVIQRDKMGVIGTDKDRQMKIAFEEGKTMGLMAGAGFVGLVFVIVEVGATATATFLLEEGIEYVIEEVTGIPIILDPIDVLEHIAKKGGKKIAKEVIVNGRKYPAGTSIEKLKYFAYNVEAYGKKAANDFADGVYSISSFKSAISKNISFNPLKKGKLIKHADVLGVEGSNLQKMIPDLEDAAANFVKSADEIRIGKWDDTYDDVTFYKNGDNYIVKDNKTGNFVTAGVGAIGNKKFNAASKVKSP